MTDPTSRTSGPSASGRPTVPGTGMITGFGAARGDDDSRTIKIDGRRVATLLESDCVRLGLHLDMVMTPDLAEQITFHHECRLAWRTSMRRLARTARSVRDIREGLQRRGHDEAVIDRVITALEQVGVLDDNRFAASAAASLARRSPASARFIEDRLRRRGIPADEAAEAASRAAGDPVETATALAAKAWRSLRSCSPETRVRRIHGRLARRGFEADIIAEAMRRIELDIPE